MHFRSIKGVYFLQNANNLNLKLFSRLYTWPTKQVICLYLRRILDNESFWMSRKSTFLAFKKSCTICPNRRGRGGGFGQNPKEQQFLFVTCSLIHGVEGDALSGQRWIRSWFSDINICVSLVRQTFPWKLESKLTFEYLVDLSGISFRSTMIAIVITRILFI